MVSRFVKEEVNRDNEENKDKCADRTVKWVVDKAPVFRINIREAKNNADKLNQYLYAKEDTVGIPILFLSRGKFSLLNLDRVHVFILLEVD